MSALALGLTLPFSSFGAAPLTPPTVAPVLVVTSAFGSTTAQLDWTASNKASSAGFGYKIYLQVDANPETEIYNEIGELPLSTTYTEPMAAGETYSFRVVPFNDAGDGPSSNTDSVILPGI